MLKSDIAERIRAIYQHDGSPVTIVDFIILLGWQISTFDDAVARRLITILDPHPLFRASATRTYSSGRGSNGPRRRLSRRSATAARVFASTQAPAAAASVIGDAVRAEPVDALQVVAALSPGEMLAAGLRPPHRGPLPRRRGRARVPALAPPPPLPPTRRRRTDGVHEATLTGFEVADQDLVPMLRLRDR